jgi:hypothetical protein
MNTRRTPQFGDRQLRRHRDIVKETKKAHRARALGVVPGRALEWPYRTDDRGELHQNASK